MSHWKSCSEGAFGRHGVSRVGPRVGHWGLSGVLKAGEHLDLGLGRGRPGGHCYPGSLRNKIGVGPLGNVGIDYSVERQKTAAVEYVEIRLLYCY
jgi:hypothetical protein